MPINRLFEGSFATTEKALDLRLQRQGLIQSNVANINTPGYTVQDFNFKDAMEKAIADQPEPAVTNPRHIAPDPVSAAEAASFKDEKRPVDLDEEMLKLSENQMMYQVGVKLIRRKLDFLQYAIDEGGK